MDESVFQLHATAINSTINAYNNVLDYILENPDATVESIKAFVNNEIKRTY